MTSLVLHESLSMTSLEISDLVGARHDSVKRTIDRLSERGVIQLPPTVISEFINSLGLPQKAEHYRFSGIQGKRDSIVVVAQLSPEFTARLVDRWQELESRQPSVSMAQVNEAVRLQARRMACDNYKRLMSAIEAIGYPDDVEIKAKVHEAELLNLTVLGMRSRDFSMWYQVSRPIRDHMAPQQLAALSYLEMIDIGLLGTGMSDGPRAEALESVLRSSFPSVAAFRDQQLSILAKRFAEKNYSLFPAKPTEARSLMAPHEIAHQLGFSL